RVFDHHGWNSGRGTSAKPEHIRLSDGGAQNAKPLRKEPGKWRARHLVGRASFFPVSELRHRRQLVQRYPEPALIDSAQVTVTLDLRDEFIGVLLQRGVGLAEGHAVRLLPQ